MKNLELIIATLLTVVDAKSFRSALVKALTVEKDGKQALMSLLLVTLRDRFIICLGLPAAKGQGRSWSYKGGTVEIITTALESTLVTQVQFNVALEVANSLKLSSKVPNGLAASKAGSMVSELMGKNLSNKDNGATYARLAKKAETLAETSPETSPEESKTAVNG
jgi:hypothetical protein